MKLHIVVDTVGFFRNLIKNIDDALVKLIILSGGITDASSLAPCTTLIWKPRFPFMLSRSFVPCVKACDKRE